MICPKCGVTNGQNSKFCGNCGALLSQVPSPPNNPLTSPSIVAPSSQPTYSVPIPTAPSKKSPSFSNYAIAAAIGSALFILVMFIIGFVSNILGLAKIQSEIFAVIALLLGQFGIGLVVSWQKPQRFLFSLSATLIPILFMFIFIIATKREIPIILVLIPLIVGPTYLGALFGKLFYPSSTPPVPIPTPAS